MNQIVISLLNWQNYNDCIQCVQSIEQLDVPNGYELELLIRDNASQNDSYTRLKQAFPDLGIMLISNNQGFAAGHYANYLQAKEMSADLFWILNSDLEVKEDALTRLVEAYEQHGEHIYGSVSLDPKQTELVDFGGAAFTKSSTKILTYNSWKGKAYFDLAKQHPESYEVESVEGSSMLIPMAVIEKHGFMQLNFFMYGEETDYCYRMRNKGIRSLLVSTSCVMHHNEGSTKVNPRLKVVPVYYRRRNALRFSMDHLGMKRQEALAYQNGIIQNLKTVLKGKLTKNKDLNYFYALGCWHAFLGKKGKVVAPENYLD